MALQFSVPVRNARDDATEATIGTAAKLIIYSGSAPANCAASATGTVLGTLSLPSDWMAAASGGVKSKSGTWEDTSADATGTAGYFRVWDTAISACGIQGTVTLTGGGGNLTLDNTNIVAGQDILITQFDITEGNS